MIYVEVEFNLKYTRTQSKWHGYVTSIILSDRILHSTHPFDENKRKCRDVKMQVM